MINVEPFFILANPRSGSSLLRIICESHPNITVPPESGFMEWWFLKYKNWSIEDTKNIKKIDAFCFDLMSSKKFETYNFDIQLYKNFIKNEQPKDYAELIALVYICFGKKKKKDFSTWGDKNNYYLHKTEILNQLYPNAKYIHLVRDGRDVATSYKALKNIKSSSKYIPKLVSEIEDIAEEWKSNNDKLMLFFNYLPPERVLRIRYEDLVQNLSRECYKITSFLNVSFDERMLNYYKINKNQNLEPKETLDWKKKTLQKPDKMNVGKYKKELSNKEISVFNTIAIKCLKAFDYEY